MSSLSEDESLNPGGSDNEAKTAMLNMASKSRSGYMRKYINFMKWRKQKGLNSFSEEVLLDYFKELSKAKLPSTLWAIYSMLKATLSAKKHVQIAKYTNLTAFIKQQSHGYISQKTKVFSPSEIETFLKEAPDIVYLSMKVALIFGVSGSCRIIEMINVRVTDIKKHSDQLLIVKIMASPTKISRSFMIIDKDVQIVEKYLALRPKNMKTDRFFIRYNLGKCRHQVIGKNNIQKFPRRIAEYLKLPNPEMYTGHCFRKTGSRLSATSDLIEFRKKFAQSILTHSPGVTVKVERAESDIPFDFIDVKVPPQASQPPSPRPVPRRRLRPRPKPSLMTELLQRQLRRDEEREREEHKLQMEWLKVEARRVETEAECNAVLRGIADVALAFLERLTTNGGVMTRH